MKGIVILTLFAILATACANSDVTPETLRRLCRYHGDDWLIPNVDDCTKFYNCAHGEPIEQSCYPGLVYNAVNRNCDYPQHTACATAIRPAPPGYE
ncbi:peritrophin-1-like [Agrilus planipennis]|uniref:Peritrophin-1-like n=1 Tax=Agrilus planipennis TaxID=224129 RepID=A0A1W4XC87_AGRPL|nr:peritrophin-1-like [Agrilus planipennis]